MASYDFGALRRRWLEISAPLPPAAAKPAARTNVTVPPPTAAASAPTSNASTPVVAPSSSLPAVEASATTNTAPVVVQQAPAPQVKQEKIKEEDKEKERETAVVNDSRYSFDLSQESDTMYATSVDSFHSEPTPSHTAYETELSVDSLNYAEVPTGSRIEGAYGGSPSIYAYAYDTQDIEPEVETAYAEPPTKSASKSEKSAYDDAPEPLAHPDTTAPSSQTTVEEAKPESTPAASLDVTLTLEDGILVSEAEAKSMHESSSSNIELLRATGKHAQQPKRSFAHDSDYARDWNGEFYSIHKLEEPHERYQSLFHLSRDFVETASLYGKIIISELFLPNEAKTIKSVAVGGLAGGEKFIVKGIFFKLAFDFALPMPPGKPPVWMYGGKTTSDENALKAPSHDLKAAIQVSNANISGIRTPLVCLVDYRGFRLMCSSVVPISGKTLVYGSNDGGKTVHKSSKKMNRKVRRVCEALNLARHQVQPDVAVWGPGDLEGHIGKDGKCYLVDLARLMPPEAPTKASNTRCIYYNMLRPELVRKAPMPLSSDAFSGWGIADPHSRKFNKDVVKVTQKLLYEGAIVKVAKHFEIKYANLSNVDTAPLTVNMSFELHSEGVNMRHLGRIKELLMSPGISMAVLIEMAARVFKNELRNQLREKMRDIKIASDEPYRIIVVNFVNTILKNRPFQDDLVPTYWLYFLQDRIRKKFNYILTEADECMLMAMSPHALLKRFCDKLALTLSVRVWEALKKPAINETAISIATTDIEHVGTVTKHMSLLLLAEGMVNYLDAISTFESNPKIAAVLLESARNKLEEVRALGHNDFTTNHSLAMVHFKLAMAWRRNDNPDARYIDLRFVSAQIKYKVHLSKAIELFTACTQSEDTTGEAMIDFGICLIYQHKLSEAIEWFRKGFERDPTLVEKRIILALKELQERYQYRSVDDAMSPLLRLASVAIDIEPLYCHAHLLRYLIVERVMAERDSQLQALLLTGEFDKDSNELYINTNVLSVESLDIILSADPVMFDWIVCDVIKHYNHPIEHAWPQSLGSVIRAAACKPAIKKALAPYMERFTHINWENVRGRLLGFADFSVMQISQLDIFSNLETFRADRSLTQSVSATLLFTSLSACPKLRGIDFCVVNSEPWKDISAITKLTGLKEVHIRGAYMEQIKPIAQLRGLTILEIADTNYDFNDETFEHIISGVGPSLRFLHLNNCQGELTEAILLNIGKHCPNLHTLRSSQLYFQTSPDTWVTVLSALQNLRFLALSNVSADPGPDAFSAISKALECLLLTDTDSAPAVSIITAISKAQLPLLRHVAFQRLSLNDAQAIESFLTAHGPQLESFTLKGSYCLDDTAICLLEKCPNLKDLRLEDLNRMSDVGLNCVAKHCHKLEHFSLVTTANITGSAIRNLLTNNKQQLLTLEISDRYTNRDEYLPYLPASLRYLAMTQVLSRDYQLRYVTQACPGLEVLEIHTGQLTDYAFRLYAAEQRNVKKLAISNMSLTDLTLDFIVLCCPNLEKLRIWHCQFDVKRGVKRLHTALPDLELYASGETVEFTQFVPAWIRSLASPITDPSYRGQPGDVTFAGYL